MADALTFHGRAAGCRRDALPIILGTAPEVHAKFDVNRAFPVVVARAAVENQR